MFDEVTENLTSADLLVPWLIAGDAASLGYSVGAKWHDKGEDHRSQTRYFFLYVFFRFASQVLLEATHIDLDRRPDLYDALVKLRDDFELHLGECADRPSI